MTKLEANISLFIITFFGVVQLVFLMRVPDTVSHFAFLCVTNLIGFLMSSAFFFQELSRLDLAQIRQSMILSAELIVFNIFLLLGVRGVGATMTDALLSTDFVFISIITFVIYRQKPDRTSLQAIVLVLLGLFLMTDANFKELLNFNVLYLIISEISFAVYLITIGRYSASTNPSIMAMGQMFFCFLFSLILWVGEAFLYKTSLKLPASVDFWASVIYISFFIRGLYGIVQVYAQKYISPLNTSLIFSTEIVMTMVISPVFTRLFGIAPEHITLLRIIGAVIIMIGVLLPNIFEPNRDLNKAPNKHNNKFKLKRKKRYWLYVPPLAVLFGLIGFLSGGIKIALFYGMLGLLAGITVTIILEGVLCLGTLKDDVVFELVNNGESLESANEIIEVAAMDCGINLKRVIEVQSCIEEISIRIFGAVKDAKIKTCIAFGEAISIKMYYSGFRYNPLSIKKGEDELDIIGLKILRHRALRASFSYSARIAGFPATRIAAHGGENRVHVVV